MVNILDNSWLNSLFGLCIVLIITLVNIILSRRKTLVVIFLDQAFFSILAILLFGWQNVIYASVLFALVIFKKYYDRFMSSYAALNYNSTIYSISRLINLLKTNKKGDIIIGNIIPTNHTQIPKNMAPLRLNNELLSRHMFITGTSGSGKTHSMTSIMKQSIDMGKPCVFFDYKGEEDILNNLEAFCKERNIPYYEFSQRKCTFSYDPLVNLNATGKVEAILNMRRWSRDGADEHYKTSMQLAIQSLIEAYDNYRAQNNDNSNYIPGLYKFCSQYKPDMNQRDGYNTIVKMLEIVLSSKAKEFLNRDNEEFSFEREDCFVICFSFTSANKALAQSLSSFIYQDIMDRPIRKTYNPKLLMCVDEFATLENVTLIQDILEKGRSGGIQTIVSLQDINQLANKTNMYFVQALLATVSNFYVHSGAIQQTAELLSGVQKYNLDSDIMNLKPPINGQPPTALFITKGSLFEKNSAQEFYKIVPYSYNTDKIPKEEKPVIKEKPVFIETSIDDVVQEENIQEEVMNKFEKVTPEINDYFEEQRQLKEISTWSMEDIF